MWRKNFITILGALATILGLVAESNNNCSFSEAEDNVTIYQKPITVYGCSCTISLTPNHLIKYNTIPAVTEEKIEFHVCKETIKTGEISIPRINNPYPYKIKFNEPNIFRDNGFLINITVRKYLTKFNLVTGKVILESGWNECYHNSSTCYDYIENMTFYWDDPASNTFKDCYGVFIVYEGSAKMYPMLNMILIENSNRSFSLQLLDKVDLCKNAVAETNNPMLLVSFSQNIHQQSITILGKETDPLKALPFRANEDVNKEINKNCTNKYISATDSPCDMNQRKEILNLLVKMSKDLNIQKALENLTLQYNSLENEMKNMSNTIQSKELQHITIIKDLESRNEIYVVIISLTISLLIVLTIILFYLLRQKRYRKLFQEEETESTAEPIQQLLNDQAHIP